MERDLVLGCASGSLRSSGRAFFGGTVCLFWSEVVWTPLGLEGTEQRGNNLGTPHNAKTQKQTKPHRHLCSLRYCGKLQTAS